jgi:hypothetical protein
MTLFLITKINTILNYIHLSTENYNYCIDVNLDFIDENPSMFIIDLDNENLDFSN